VGRADERSSEVRKSREEREARLGMEGRLVVRVGWTDVCCALLCMLYLQDVVLYLCLWIICMLLFLSACFRLF
jgi:hypothetical protein